jgi:death on curing protein
VSGKTPKFLTLEQVESIHADSLVEFGGSAGTRDPGLVESALASAQNTFRYGDGDLFDIAAAYAFHLGEAQAFLDGNKRTAIWAALTFLRGNECRIKPDQDQLYDAMIAIAEKRLSKADLAGIFRRLARPTEGIQP